ncbi:hypothetical protein ABEW61_20250 [Paenibacillus amylolyticus]
MNFSMPKGKWPDTQAAFAGGKARGQLASRADYERFRVDVLSAVSF